MNEFEEKHDIPDAHNDSVGDNGTSDVPNVPAEEPPVPENWAPQAQNPADNQWQQPQAQNPADNQWQQPQAQNPADNQWQQPQAQNPADNQWQQPAGPGTVPGSFAQGTYGYHPNPTGAIEFSKVEKGKAEKLPNNGFRAFLVVICVILVVAIGAGGGYIFGKSSSSKNGTTNSSFTSDDLADRPSSDVEEGSATYVYDQVVDSVVLIDVYSTDDTSSGSEASGVIYSADGYIVTNDHIYEDIPNPKFIVTLADGTQLDATYVAGDSRSDLAVLKVNASGLDLQVATFGDSSQALIGEEIVTIGNPSGSELSFSLTEGTISAVDRWAANSSNYSMKFIQIDAAVNPGNSGGALCNMYGQVIGITAWKYVGEYYENIAFAIPSTTVKRVCDDLISSGYVTGRAKLGIKYQMVDAVTAKINGYDDTGLLIAEITSGTPIASTSAQVGDLITQINGQDITSSSVVLQILEDSSPGDTVTLTVLSGTSGSAYTINVELLEDKGTSSYTTEKSTTSGSSGSTSSYSGGEFDFPDGD